MVETQPRRVSKANNIIKALSDTKDYRGLILENEMRILLVSDKESEISAASLSVQVGQMFDPKNLSGLSHLCEHVVTLGSKKYPDTHSFQNFLADHGGKLSTFTYATMTKFYFEIASEKLEEALDRFANFFIAPLFEENAVSHEIRAVNTEFERNLFDDQLRIRQLNKHLADPKHPFRNQGLGNTLTLETIPKKINLNVREALVTFFNQWYSSNTMCLVVVGNESLNKLEQWTMTKFTSIPNKELKLDAWSEKPYAEEEYATKVYVSPINDLRSILLSFTTKDTTVHVRSRPEDYIVHLIEHKGRGSIHYELRNRHWSNKIQATHIKIPRGFGFLEITINLTEEGLDHIDDIIQLVFEYIRMLREEGPKKWINDELVNMHELNFQYNEKESVRSFTLRVVQSLQYFPIEEVITGPVLNIEWRPDLIRDLINALTPSNCRIFIIAKRFEPTMYDTEPIFKTKYRKEIIAANVINKWKQCEMNKAFVLPDHNPYIPIDFQIFAKETTKHDKPVIIYNTEYLRSWYMQDMESQRPMTYYHVDIANPIASHDAVTSNLIHMFVVIFFDALQDVHYYARLAGMYLNVSQNTHGISIYMGGFTHKLPLLLQTVLTQLFDFQINNKLFDHFKDERIRYLKNALAEQPYQRSLYCLRVLLSEKSYPDASYIDIMTGTTLNDFAHFIGDFFNRLNIECFVYGNTDVQYAMSVSNYLKQQMQKTNSLKMPILMKQLLPPRDYKFEEGTSYVFDFFVKYSKRCSTLLYLQCGARSDVDAVLVSLLAHIIDHPCRQFLRTKHMAGCFVKCNVWDSRNSTGIYIVAQSDKDPVLIEEQIEKCLAHMLDIILNMSNEAFEKHKQSYQLSSARSPSTSLHKFQLFAEEISSGLFQFNKIEKTKNTINVVKKQDVVHFYTSHISKDASRRRALFVYIYGQNATEKRNSGGYLDIRPNLFSYHSPEESDYNGHKKILDTEMFKASLELYPLAKPYLNIGYRGKQEILHIK